MNFKCKKYLLFGLSFSVLFFEQIVLSKPQSNAVHSGSISQDKKRRNVLDHGILARQDTLRRLAKLKICFVAPAGGVDTGFRKEYLKDIRKFGVSIPNEAFISKNVFKFSDTDDNRLLRFKHGINSDSDIIWAMRGGFGSYKLISDLKNLPHPNPKKKKILIGFSDITALNLFVSQNWKDWTVIHAPMIVHLAKNDYHHLSWSILLDILENKISQYKITGLSLLNKTGEKANTEKIRGKLTGGNLTLIESSLKTDWEIDTDDKILFIEDCNEPAPSVYRSMYHLKEAGKLSKVRAIVFGHFVGVPEYKKYLKHFASELDIPVYITDQFGHGKNNIPLIYNADGCIDNDSLVVNLPKNR